MKETWKNIEGYDGLYQVSNRGRLRSWKKKIGMRWTKSKSPKILSLSNDADGYKVTGLCHKGKIKMVRINRLVADAFIPNLDEKKYTNHKNGIKWDNRIENLEWATVSENTQHAYDNGLACAAKGERHGNSKLTKDDIIKIRRLSNTMSYKEIGKMFHIHYNHVGSIVRKEVWKHV